MHAAAGAEAAAEVHDRDDDTPEVDDPLNELGHARERSRLISKAAAEQAAGIRQVSGSVDRITTMSHQIASATNQQRSGGEQVMRAAERMRELTAFVTRATGEQAASSREITEAVEGMVTKISLVHRAATEVQSGSELIVNAIERIKLITRENTDLADEMDESIGILNRQAETLLTEVRKIKTSGSGG